MKKLFTAEAAELAGEAIVGCRKTHSVRPAISAVHSSCPLAVIYDLP
jgi:hypothetical protein